MADHTDDWMHPQMSSRWQASDRKADPRPFLIQRQRRVICSWVGSGPPTEWDLWSSHKTREERDAELKRLRADHPAWRLRPAHETEIAGRRDVKVEDEEADLVARLLALRMRRGKDGAAVDVEALLQAARKS